MLAQLGFQVSRLIRISFGPFQFGGMPEGQHGSADAHVARTARRANRRAAGANLAGRRGSETRPPKGPPHAIRGRSRGGAPALSPRAGRGGERRIRESWRERATRSSRNAWQNCARRPGPSVSRAATPLPTAAARIPVTRTRTEKPERPAAKQASRQAAPARRAAARVPPGHADARRRRTVARTRAEGPKSQAIRPTADRLRESLFNILVHAYGDPVEDARVLDLFAGTGALGIEALSRGAAFALFVDEGVEARALLRANVEALGLGGATQGLPPRRDQTRPGLSDGAVLAGLRRSALRQRVAEQGARSARATAAGSSPARWSSWRKRRRRLSRRRKASPSWSGAPMTTPNSSSCACLNGSV